MTMLEISKKERNAYDRRYAPLFLLILNSTQLKM